MSQASALRALLRSGRMIVAAAEPSTDEERDVAARYAKARAGTSMTLGYPDYGLITMTEMVANATRIVNSISIPLITLPDLLLASLFVTAYLKTKPVQE